MNKPNTKTPRLETSTGIRLTQDEYEQLVHTAARHGMTTSRFTRQVLFSGAALSQKTHARLQMEFQAAGEERIRLLIAAATKGRDVEDPGVQAESNAKPSRLRPVSQLAGSPPWRNGL